MVDRVASDHESVTDHRVRLGTVGRTDRPEIELPAEATAALAAGDRIRLLLSGTEYHAVVREGVAGDLVLRGAYGNPRLARDGSPAADELADWRAEEALATGAELRLDVVTPGFVYGLRCPGDRVVYPLRDPPDEGLTDIARSLEE